MRVNIEETAWPRVEKLSKMIGEEPELVMGKLSYLWHESQAEQAHECSKKQLLIWANLYAKSKEVQEKWIEGFLLFHFLEENGDQFVIIGNKRHIEVYTKIVSASAKGVEAKRQRQNELNASPNRSVNHLVDRLVDRSVNRSVDRLVNPIQFNSIQCSSIQINSKKEEEEEKENTLQPEFAIEEPSPKGQRKPSRPPKAATTTRSQFFIARYCEAWKVKHGSSPDITGKDAGIANRVCKNMTEERVKTLLRAFFTMPDAYLYQQRHPLELFERDLKKIAAFANSGEFVTRRQTQQNDDMASNMMLLKKVREGEA